MKAASYTRTGSARDVLTVGEVDRPEPGPGQVRVRVRTSAVNPTDVKTRDGATDRPFDGIRIPHQDGVGAIDAVGDGVDAGRVGQRVWVWLASPGGDAGQAVAEWGTCGEWTVVPEHQATPLPDAASDDLGACLGVPAMTAYHCLFADGSPAGANVLVSGGAGAVGHYGIELGRWAGATVVSTVSGPEKAELARAAGAHHVLNYRDDDIAEQIRAAVPQVDRVVEVALSQNLGLDLAVVGNGASIVSYAATAADPTLPVRACMTANVNLRFVLLYGVPADTLRAAAQEVTAAAAMGSLTALPMHRFTLDDVAAAHEAVESGTTGKVVVDIA
ncbi:NADPH:quinone reductase [Pseudonocardia sp. KRD291]|uniref:NADPH:quinone reductase n=1 Tax=Pseudonocardia sp. KRD291 TaxID=2792007 RepID=UPI001C49D59E|nr:NADPH:quinone reductase [Pseudonocardia sp. KRD291]MBW0105829.1 NADPH:quinone reductase [Pseudonocardia sp. KRD291]